MSSIVFKYMVYIFNRLLDYFNHLVYTPKQGGDYMTIEQKIKMALSYTGISQSELARQIGTTPQNLNQKIKRNSLTKEEMDKIAVVLGGSWRAEFVFPDGTTI